MKFRTAAMVAVMTTAVTKVREYAREHPDEAGQAVDKVEDFVRGRAAPKHSAYIDKGSKAVRQGLGLPLRTVSPASRDTDVEDPDPDTDEPWSPHAADDLRPLAPNPSPGTGDDPQPRRDSDDPSPMTPGEHLQS
jgi:hypothetical protein